MSGAVTAGLIIASGAMAYEGQRQAAKAQEQANEQARTLALRNQKLQIQALNNQEEEDAIRAGEALRDNSAQAEAARARATVAAGESGVSGLSVQSLLGDLTRVEEMNASDIIQTQDFGQRQRQLNREGVSINSASTINQLPAVSYPSFFESAVSTGTQAYTGYKKSNYNEGVLNDG